MVYRRVQWMVEIQFVLAEFQAGFRNFHSCMDNLTSLIQPYPLGLLEQSTTDSDFLNVAGAFK